MSALFRGNTVRKTFGKIAQYNKVFQIINLQLRNKNWLILQGYVESTVSKCTFLCFGFGDSGVSIWGVRFHAHASAHP